MAAKVQMHLLLLLPALLGPCLGARTALPSSQSKSFWDQIKANNEQRKPSRPDDPGLADPTGPHQPSPSLREVLESKKAKRNLECRPDFCYRATQPSGGSSSRICGNDGKTYESRCMLQFLRRCHGQRVKVRHLGACGAPIGPPVSDGLGLGSGNGGGGGGGGQMRRSCQQSRLRALSQSSRGEQVIYVPQCRRDGNFRRVQCNYQLKYCFCVRKRSGKPLPGTGVQLPNRPMCNSRRRRKQQPQKSERQQQQQRQEQQQKKKRKDRRKGGSAGDTRKNRCSSRQRAQFNRNILKQFEIEFNASVTSRGGVFKPKREAGSSGGGLPIHGVVEKTLQQPERRSAEWKFSELDANSDGQLSYRETKALRKVTRTNIKPKGCARRFFSTCDLNSNKRLERAEWILCFGLENLAATSEEAASPAAAAASAAVEAQPSAAKLATVGVAAGTAAHTAPELGPPSLDDAGISGGAVVSSGGSGGGKGSLLELVSRPRKRKRAKESRPFAHKSCPLAHEEALEKNRQLVTQRQLQRTLPGAEMSVFVPECSPDGKYAKRQCHSDTSDRLCFCMDPNTGQVLKSRGGDIGAAGVDCESAHLRARAAAGFRGCSQSLLRKFAAQLTDLMVQETRDAWTPQDRHLSVEARSLRLRFQRADVNRDGRLDRSEQKWWRQSLRARWKASRERRPTRRCAANFLRFCNADRDSAVTLPELQACLGLPAA